MTDRIRVVVADDSPSVCRLICAFLAGADDFEVVARTHTGMQTLEAVRAYKPHVITLDCDLPDMSGLDALDLIMKTCPTPVIMLSGMSRAAAEITREALQLGAIDVIWKYAPGVDTDLEALQNTIRNKIRVAARVKVIGSLHLCRPGSEDRLAVLQGRPVDAAPRDLRLAEQVVIIGASTGGPVVLKTILEALIPDFKAALIVVQHMPALFTRALARQLNRCVAVEVREARDGDYLYAGVALISPGDHHLVLDTERRVRLRSGPKISGYRPCIDLSIRSAVEVFGLQASVVLLTGMGCDGVDGARHVREQGGTVYVQDPATCVVDSMSTSAIERGFADHIAAPDVLADLLRQAYCKS